ncbi:MAG: Undecaprenyl diphosphate synthase, partial [uncultured Craurococcus sp.]
VRRPQAPAAARHRLPGRAAAACGDHHGWQPPLGGGPRPAGGAWPQGGSGGGAPRHRGLRPPGHRLADPLRLLLGELAPPGRRGDGAHRAAARLPPLRGGDLRQGGHPPPGDRGPGALRRRDRARDRSGRGGDRRGHAAERQCRPQLWRAGRDGRRGAGDGGGGAGRAARPGGDRRGGLRPASLHRGHAGSGPHHPHLGRAAAVEFPALAGGLCRVRLPGRALAGLWRRAPGTGAPRLWQAGAAFRRPHGM